jgi:hypothetical protein
MVGELFGPLTGRSRSVAARSARAAAFLSAFILMVILLAAPAQAAPETIAGPGGEAGQVSEPVGVAVHQASGDLYVADLNNNRVSKFDADGEFLLAWGFGVRDGETATLQTCGSQATPPQSWCFPSAFGNNDDAGNIIPSAVAVDQASGAVYVADRDKRRVTKFTSSGEFVFLVGKDVNATKVALGGGATQAEKNICTAASGDTCTIGAVGTGLNEFTSPRSLAVTPSGVVWVGDTDRLVSFDSTGAPGAEIALPGGGNTRSLALDSSGDFYVKSESLLGIRKLEAGTGALLETLDEAGQPQTVTLDAADNVYVGDATSPYRFKVYNPAGEQISQFGAGEVIGSPGGSFVGGANSIAIGESAGRLYAASSFSGAPAVQAFPLPEPGPLVEKQGVEEDIKATTATLTGQINPENEETTYRFEYGTTAGYGQSTPTQTLPGTGFESEAVQAALGGLIPATTYHFRLVATNHCKPAEPAVECTATGPDATFTTRPAVDILSQWVTDVTASTARLHAEMDPLGPDAEVWLEYGTSDSYGQVVSLPGLPEGFGPLEREALLAGLQAATTYHFRFAARDERAGVVYTVHGPDSTFTTQFGGLGFELADNRIWEMVSPPDKHGAKLVGGAEVHLQASADGSRIAYPSRLPVESDPEGNRASEPSMNLAGRDGDGSWHSRDITPRSDRVSGITVGLGHEYKLFGSDLSKALLEPRSGTPLSEEASERTPYLRENTEPPVYRPLVTAKEPFNNVPPGTEFGGTTSAGEVKIRAVNPGFTHFVLQSRATLVEGPAVNFALYEWSNGQLKPVSVLPTGELIQGRIDGSPRGAVSADGSRVFWDVGGSSLYVRDTVAGESARLDVPQPDASGLGVSRPVFQGASADGSVVFFSDSRRLTSDASPAGPHLYRCGLPAGSVASGCATLTNISAPLEAGGSAGIEGLAQGLGGDGETIYFVARGVLDEAPNERGDSAASGHPNVYVWQQGDGVRYIATLGNEDSSVWGKDYPPDPLEEALLSSMTSVVSPGGRYLTFMSQRSLSGYDNRDVTTGEPVQEVFRYDAFADRLECVSCNPTGVRPRGANPPRQHDSVVNPSKSWNGLRVAATLPVATSLGLSETSLYRPRAMLDNGRVFFNAIDALVPADSNGQWDVYEYEPVGIGSCQASSGGAATVRSAGGCVSLISSGTAEEEAAFFDASETGDDAFFFTPARLSVFDADSELDIYDARVNGVTATRDVVPECLGEACQPPPQALRRPTPASASFQGPGNVHPAARKKCPKGKRRVRRQGRVRCVAKRRQRPDRGHRRHQGAGGDKRVAR